MPYINPPLNYMGGKFKLLTQLDPLMDKNKRSFYDVFTGGGAVAMNLGLNYQRVYMNDLLSTGIHQSLCKEGTTFIKEMQSHLIGKEDKEGYAKLRTSFNALPTPAKLWALILSCNSNMMRFNKKGEFNQTFGKRTFNPSTEKKLQGYMQRLKKFESKGIKLYYSTHDFKDERECFSDEDGMVYLDPPYFNTEAGYNTFWDVEDELLLLERCLEAKASVAVSGVLFDSKENSPLLVGLANASWIQHNLKMDYGKIRKAKEITYQEVLFTNYK